VVTALNHDLLGACIAVHCTAVVEHFIAGLDEKQVAIGRDLRLVQATPSIEVLLALPIGRGGGSLLEYDTSGRMTGAWDHSVSYASIAFP